MTPSGAYPKTTIALDAMGGDGAPKMVLKAALRVAEARPDTNFLIFGKAKKIEPLLKKYDSLAACSEFMHADDVVLNEDKPSQALRQRKESSMAMAIQAVKEGRADGMVSAGNTGALMAMSKIMLRMLPGIDRPAIATKFPNKEGSCVMLDLGANVDCSETHLFQFAIMGDAFARVVLDVEFPSIGLLNVGSEDVKGSDAVKNAAQMIAESDFNLNYYGYVEGNDIALGTVDVIVSDGFSGNIALKTAEGIAQLYSYFLKKAFKSSPLAMLGYILAKPALKRLKNKLDPRLHNGAMFLGLNGIVVKSHGGTDEIGFENAINVAIDLVRNGINQQIVKELDLSHVNALMAESVREKNNAET